jgi:hypothetical protein
VKKMTPKFRLDDSVVRSDAGISPNVIGTYKIEYTNRPFERCDNPPGGVGCGDAEAKKTQQDIGLNPYVASVIKMHYKGGPHKRCDVPDMGGCCGCDVADLKRTQQDLYVSAA